ncbi:MAG: thiol-activated cytolysin family protein [Calditrichia bacterium]
MMQSLNRFSGRWMGWQKLARAAWLLPFILVFIISCEKDVTKPPTQTPETIEQVVDMGNDFPPVQEKETVVDSSVSTHEENGTIWKCSSKTVSVVKAPEDYPNFNPNAEIVFPGNLLQGKTITQATPEPISVRRAGGTIVMNILNGGGSYSETVPVVNLDNINYAQNQILKNFSGPKAANFTFTMEEVNSQQKLALALNVNVGSLTTKVKTSLKFSTDKQYNRFLVKLNQSYFTMVYQLPTSYGEVFAPDVTAADLMPFVGPSNPATFISSVTYGRIFYMLIESTESREAMSASIDASFRAAIAGGSMGASAKYVNQLANRKVKAFALGGDDQLALSAVLGGFEQLKDYLSNGADIRTGMPLSYQIRALKKPYPVVQSKVATEYEIKNCVPIALNSNDELFSYRADSLVIEQGGKITEWGDCFGLQNKANLYETHNYLPITRVENAVNGYPALRFWSLSAHPGDHFQNSPAHFVNSNYTIFAVVNIKDGYFMWGSDFETGKNLHTGYRDPNTFTLDHYSSGLDVNTSNLGDFQLFTLVFDVQNGMAIYENGFLRGSDATKTIPLSSNNGASIGLNSLNGNQDGMIAEICAYGTALKDSDRKIVEELLMRKYALGPYGN